MVEKKTKVIDVHCHLFSPGLGKEISECVPVPSRFDPKKGILKSFANSEPRMLTEEEQIAEADRLGIDMVWLTTMPLHYFDRGKIPFDSPHWLTLAQVDNNYLHFVINLLTDLWLLPTYQSHKEKLESKRWSGL
jgi:hypothetical protein